MTKSRFTGVKPLLKPNFRNFFEVTNGSLVSEYGNYILINTSFSAANPVVGKERLRIFWENEPTYSADTKRLLKKKMDFLEDVVDKYIYAIHKMADKFPDINFIIRPHPSESEANYKSAFNKYKNVFVNKSGNVAEWILASKGVIHYDCTTGMEAVLAGKPTISFLPKKDDEILAWLPVAVSKQATTVDDLIGDVGSIIKGTFNHSLDSKTVTEWTSFINNIREDASDIIARTMKPVRCHNTPIESLKNNSPITKLSKHYYCIKYFVKRVLKIMLRRKPSSSKSKLGKLKTKEVRYKLEMLAKINGFSHAVYV